MEEMDGAMTGRLDSFGTFFLPGPSEVRREVLEAMLKPMIPHRSTEFEDLFARLQTGLQSVFQTARPVFVSAASATGQGGTHKESDCDRRRHSETNNAHCNLLFLSQFDQAGG